MIARPVVFVGSSTEGQAVVDALVTLLEKDADLIPWTLTASLGVPFLDGLMQQLDRADFAILVMSPDDRVECREVEYLAPRDNVLYELGLFSGRLGPARCYCVVPESPTIKLPSDLLGITTAKYRTEHAGGLAGSLAAAASRIRAQFSALGRRARSRNLNLRDVHRLNEFVENLKGSWWEFITPVRVSALGLLTIRADSAVDVHIRGHAYRPDGSFAADWSTVGCGADPRDRTLIYTWSGRYVDAPDKTFEGYGDLTFHEAGGPFKSGHGVFAETNATHLTDIAKRTGELVRCTDPEIAVMHSGDAAQISLLIRGKLAGR